jgi:hypothetical protein
MRHYVWYSGPLLVGIALLLRGPFQIPPTLLAGSQQDIARLSGSEIRWEFDTGG